MDTNEFTKSRRVVVSGRLGVSIRFQNGIGSNNLVFKRNLFGVLSTFLWGSSYLSQVSNNLFGVLSLSGTRFTSNQHRLILQVGQHVSVCCFCNSPQMRWNLIPSLSKVQLYTGCSVNGISLVRIDNNTEKT